jgi:hypothetical protein
MLEPLEKDFFILEPHRVGVASLSCSEDRAGETYFFYRSKRAIPGAPGFILNPVA